MMDFRITEITSRLGNFSVIKMGSAVLITPCDTRMKILEALAKKEMTSEEISKKTGAAYSTVMDHMDVLERLGVVTALLRRTGGRRRIHFRISENPMQRIEELFARS